VEKIFNKLNTSKVIEILTLLLVVFVGYLLFSNNTPGFLSYNNSDIHRGFQRGISVLNGTNPYLEFNPNQILNQEKVPGFFPLYFYFMALLAWISNYSFINFMDTLRIVVFVSYSSLGLIIYWLVRKQNKLLAVTCAIVFMFNRWTLNDAIDLKQDTYILLMLLVSLVSLKSRTALSFLLFGVATGVKHLTLLVFPIYLLELYYTTIKTTDGYKKSSMYLLLMVLPIVLPAIPFIVSTPKHFAYSLMYNVTRTPEVSNLNQNTGFDKMLVLYNQDRFNSPFFYALPRLPMLITLCLLVILYLKKSVTMWQYCFLAYLVFVAFNPVLFGQYYVWLFVFIPLALRQREQ